MMIDNLFNIGHSTYHGWYIKRQAGGVIANGFESYYDALKAQDKLTRDYDNESEQNTSDRREI